MCADACRQRRNGVKMKLLVVTGMSGSGKSKTLMNLEDSGYYCLDNLPINLLPNVIEWILNLEDFPQKIAVTADVRNHDISTEIERLFELISKKGVDVKVLFLDCEDSILLKRYKESRRLHPLMSWDNAIDLATAIRGERKILEKLRQHADYVIDTSQLTTSKLREKMIELLASGDEEDMLINFVAFGYKYGILADADIVFDVRCLPNPYYVEELREKTGEDAEVRDYVMSTGDAAAVMDRIVDYLELTIPMYRNEGKAQLVVGLGCTGGQHRSMTFAKLLYQHFAGKGLRVRCQARDMDKNKQDIMALFRG